MTHHEHPDTEHAAWQAVELLAEYGFDGLAANIFHYGEYTIDQTKRYLAERGVTIRPDVAITLDAGQ